MYYINWLHIFDKFRHAFPFVSVSFDFRYAYSIWYATHRDQKLLKSNRGDFTGVAVDYSGIKQYKDE